MEGIFFLEEEYSETDLSKGKVGNGFAFSYPKPSLTCFLPVIINGER
jgi:hypothetical protein